MHIPKYALRLSNANLAGRRAGAVVLTTAPEGVTPFVHGVTSSVQGVTIEQQRVTLEQHFCGSHMA